MTSPEPEIPWRRLGAVAPDGLSQARLQAHWALDGLARAARALVPSTDDDSHHTSPASPVRCWPHHFDKAVEACLDMLDEM